MEPRMSSQRLRKIMDDMDLRQVDVLERCKPYCEMLGVKMNRSDISQYLSGKAAPSQHKLTVLARALNTSEAWLMGIDPETLIKRGETLAMLEYSDNLDLFIAIDELPQEKIEIIRTMVMSWKE